MDCLVGLALLGGLLVCSVVDGFGSSFWTSLATINDQLRTGTDKGNLTV